MDNTKATKLKPGLLSNKPIVNDSCSDSDSSTESKRPEAYKYNLSSSSKPKSSLKRNSDHRNHRSRSRDHHKNRSHRSHSRRRHSGRSRSKDRKHHKHRNSSKSDKIKERKISPKKSDERSPKRSRSPRNNEYPDKRRNYKDELKNRYCDDAMDPMTRANKLASNVDCKVGQGRVERARRAQDYQAKELVKKAEKLTGITLPKFYNPSAINPLKFAETEQKRKLLWSKKNDPSEENKSVWNVTSVIASRGDDKGAAKFRKLMGIHENTNDLANPNLTDLSKKVEEQAELFRRLDADYQSARNQTHTSRGVGLGYNQSVFIDPSLYLAGKRDVN